MVLFTPPPVGSASISCRFGYPRAMPRRVLPDALFRRLSTVSFDAGMVSERKFTGACFLTEFEQQKELIRWLGFSALGKVGARLMLPSLSPSA